MNILESLISCLKSHKKSFGDVKWLGSKDFAIPIDNFTSIAQKTEETGKSDIIPYDFVAVGMDFWVERCTDEVGHGWWQFKKLPPQPSIEHTIQALNIYQLSSEEYEQWQKRRREKYRRKREDYPYCSILQLKDML